MANKIDTPNTSEMVARVQTAIIDELARQKIAASWGNSFQGLNPPVRWDALASAVIKVMREPTDAMVDQADALHGSCYTCNRDWYPDPSTAWRAMIDAALGD